jgi:hypothetical protein
VVEICKHLHLSEMMHLSFSEHLHLLRQAHRHHQAAVASLLTVMMKLKLLRQSAAQAEEEHLGPRSAPACLSALSQAHHS